MALSLLFTFNLLFKETVFVVSTMSCTKKMSATLVSCFLQLVARDHLDTDNV